MPQFAPLISYGSVFDNIYIEKRGKRLQKIKATRLQNIMINLNWQISKIIYILENMINKQNLKQYDKFKLMIPWSKS